MQNTIDCLLVGYSGFRLSETNTLIQKDSLNVGTIERQFNAAIAYLCTYISRKGFSYDYINSLEDEEELLIRKLKTEKIMSVGISTTFCDNMLQVIQIINLVRKYNSTVKIILGGAFIVLYVRDLKKQNEKTCEMFLKRIGADVIIDSFYGEDELVEVLTMLKQELPLDQVCNIYYKKNNECNKRITV
jgi:hypothetical protein